MKQIDIKKVAQAITEEPTEIIITREPDGWLDKLLIKYGYRSLKRSFFIKPQSLRMNYKITSLLMDISIEKMKEGDVNDWSNRMRINNTFILAEIIATYFHGKPKEQTPLHLIDYFMDNMTDEELLDVTNIIKGYMDIIPFMNSISSIRSLDVISPGLSEESPADTGEIIAHGESLEAQQSTSDSV